jgi:ABC-2 type transport system permease protein
MSKITSTITPTITPARPTITTTADSPHAAANRAIRPEMHTSVGAAAITVAGRTLRKFWRTPQLIVVGALTSAMFLLIFRYVFGGAIQTGSVAYADFLIPAMAVNAGLFASGAVGVADDIEGGLFDRLRSLPIPRSSILLGRSLADTALILWATLITIGLGYATGFRFHGDALDALAAIALCVVFGAAFTWPFIYMGLVSGSSQAAQGMSFMAFPFVFVSSTYVPVGSMPGWMQPVARNQPVTQMVGAVRALALGDHAQEILGHSAGWFAGRALAWAVVIVAVFATLATRKFSRS